MRPTIVKFDGAFCGVCFSNSPLTLKRKIEAFAPHSGRPLHSSLRHQYQRVGPKSGLFPIPLELASNAQDYSSSLETLSQELEHPAAKLRKAHDRKGDRWNIRAYCRPLSNDKKTIAPKKKNNTTKPRAPPSNPTTPAINESRNHDIPCSPAACRGSDLTEKPLLCQ